jgi:hypothetical protein
MAREAVTGLRIIGLTGIAVNHPEQVRTPRREMGRHPSGSMVGGANPRLSD